MVFDGGTSNISSGTRIAISGVRSVQLINGATVSNSGGSSFVNDIHDNPIALLNSTELIVGEGSTLLRSGESCIGNRTIVRIEGRLESGPLSSSVNATFSSRSQSIIKSGYSGAVFWGNSIGNNITINSGATFDFVNTDGGPLIHSSNTGITTIQGDTPRTAFWNLGA